MASTVTTATQEAIDLSEAWQVSGYLPLSKAYVLSQALDDGRERFLLIDETNAPQLKYAVPFYHVVVIDGFAGDPLPVDFEWNPESGVSRDLVERLGRQIRVLDYFEELNMHEKNCVLEWNSDANRFADEWTSQFINRWCNTLTFEVDVLCPGEKSRLDRECAMIAAIRFRQERTMETMKNARYPISPAIRREAASMASIAAVASAALNEAFRQHREHRRLLGDLGQAEDRGEGEDLANGDEEDQSKSESEEDEDDDDDQGESEEGLDDDDDDDDNDNDDQGQGQADIEGEEDGGDEQGQGQVAEAGEEDDDDGQGQENARDLMDQEAMSSSSSPPPHRGRDQDMADYFNEGAENASAAAAAAAAAAGVGDGGANVDPRLLRQEAHKYLAQQSHWKYDVLSAIILPLHNEIKTIRPLTPARIARFVAERVNAPSGKKMRKHRVVWRDIPAGWDSYCYLQWVNMAPNWIVTTVRPPAGGSPEVVADLLRRYCLNDDDDGDYGYNGPADVHRYHSRHRHLTVLFDRLWFSGEAHRYCAMTLIFDVASNNPDSTTTTAAAATTTTTTTSAAAAAAGTHN
jgi:segregation and condensation protein B